MAETLSSLLPEMHYGDRWKVTPTETGQSILLNLTIASDPLKHSPSDLKALLDSHCVPIDDLKSRKWLFYHRTRIAGSSDEIGSYELTLQYISKLEAEKIKLRVKKDSLKDGRVGNLLRAIRTYVELH